MKKSIFTLLGLFVVITALNAGGFEERYEMMESRIKNKMEKLKDNPKAHDFLAQKLACIKAATTEDGLKACKEKYHPKELKKLIK
jgi:hypothetical protein